MIRIYANMAFSRKVGDGKVGDTFNINYIFFFLLLLLLL